MTAELGTTKSWRQRRFAPIGAGRSESIDSDLRNRLDKLLSGDDAGDEPMPSEPNR